MPRQAIKLKFQHTAARRRLVPVSKSCANSWKFQHTAARRRLAVPGLHMFGFDCFNTQPPEGGWERKQLGKMLPAYVSTHSRPKAAGYGVS